ncbi:MAG: hypothetical protein KDC98_09250 [Planctomycetes bacterium]|nr:hypothetical protein [Planctomycetota bacterium]
MLNSHDMTVPGSVSIAIPSSPSFVGFQFFAQGVALGYTCFPCSLQIVDVSDGLRCTVGY